MATVQINQLGAATTLSASDRLPIDQFNGSVWSTQYTTLSQLLAGNSYTLPIASSTTLGGIKVNGGGLTIAADGTLSTTGSGYTLPAATSSTLGGVTIGSGLNNSGGNISVSYGTGANTAVQGNDSRVTNAVSSASPTFTGTPTAPTAATSDNSTTLATTQFVKNQSYLTTSTLPIATSTVLGVVKPDGTTLTNNSGAISVSYGTSSTTAAVGNDSRITGAAPTASPTFTGNVSGSGATTFTVPTVASTGDNSTNAASTAWVTNKVAAVSSGVTQVVGFSGSVTLSNLVSGGVAPLASPTFTGTPTVPGYLSTSTASSTYAPIASPTFTGTVTIPSGASISGFAPLASPTLTGTPSAPTAAAGTSTTQLATTSFVTTADNLKANIASPTFTGTVTIPSGASISGFAPLASPTFTGTVTIPGGASISGFAPLASPAFTGTPTAPTVSTNDNSTSLATTAWVGNKIAAVSSGVTQVVGFSGNVTLANLTSGGVAALASPALTGTPTAPTATSGTNTTQLATTQFVTSAVVAATTGVSSVIGNTGAVTLSQLVTGGVAPLASPTFTGTVTIPGGASISGFATLASPTFTGTVTIPGGASISGFAPLASPALTGTPTAPTATGGTNTTQLATTAFVTAAVSASTTGVSSVIGNTGAVTLSQLVTGGVAPLASPALTGTPTAPTPPQNNNTTQIATTAYTIGQLSGYATLASPTFTGTPTVPGYLTTSTASSTYAPLASPTFTGSVNMTGATVTVPTATSTDSSTLAASTAFVKAQITGGVSGSLLAGNGTPGFIYTDTSGNVSVKNAYPFSILCSHVGTAVITNMIARWIAPVDVYITAIQVAAPNLTGSGNGFTVAITSNSTSIGGLSSCQVTGTTPIASFSASSATKITAGQDITATLTKTGTIPSTCTLIVQPFGTFA